jgi:ATP-dependent RNA helicase DeaD
LPPWVCTNPSSATKEPTPIQREAIPCCSPARTCSGRPATGTGKTAAFALPMLHASRTRGAAGPHPRVGPGAHARARHAGGRGHLTATARPRAKVLRLRRPAHRTADCRPSRGVHIVVATPGRASTTSVAVRSTSTASRWWCSTRPTRCSTWASPRTSRASSRPPPRTPDRAVLGHDAAAHQLHRQAPPDATPVRINVVPATPGPAPARYARAPTSCSATTSRRPGPHPRHRIPRRRIVFCRTRHEVDQLTETMNARGYRAEALHGGMDQAQRDRVMSRLRDGTADCWSPPTWRPAASTSTRSPTWSTTTCRPPRRATCTASVASAGPVARVWPSRWPSRASSGRRRRPSPPKRQTGLRQTGVWQQAGLRQQTGVWRQTRL